MLNGFRSKGGLRLGVGAEAGFARFLNRKAALGVLGGLTGVLLLLLGPGPVHAQTSSPTNAVEKTTESSDPRNSISPDSTDATLTTKERDGRIVTTDQVEDAINDLYDSNLRPERPEYRALSPELRQKLIEFQKLRERYLREQQRLFKEYKGATDQERQIIRERLRDRRERWLEQSRSIKESARERLRDLVRELPKHREALEAVRESVRDQADEIRERRGQD